MNRRRRVSKYTGGGQLTVEQLLSMSPQEQQSYLRGANNNTNFSNVLPKDANGNDIVRGTVGAIGALPETLNRVDPIPMNNNRGLTNAQVGALSTGAQMASTLFNDETVGGGIGGGALSGAGTGASLGTAIMPGIGTAIGAGVGALAGGIFGGISGGKKQKERKRRNRIAANNSEFMAQERGQLLAESNNNFQGNPNVVSFRDGGSLPLNDLNITDGGSSQEIANGMFLSKGNTHEQGGIGLDLNSDQITDAEIEDNEMIDMNKERVFSDTLKPSKEELATISKNTGVKVKGTYSNVAKTLAEEKAKIEDKEGGARASNTRDLMLERISNQEDMLFASQQEENGDFAPSSRRKDSVPEGALGMNLKNLGNKFLTGIEENPELTSNALSGLNLLANRKAVRGLETNIQPNLIKGQGFNFTDTRQAQEQKNAIAARNLEESLQASSAQGGATAQANILAKRFSAANDINARENQRRDAAMDRFSDREFRRNAINASTSNRFADANLTRRNQQRSLLQRANNTLLNDIQADRQATILNENEVSKMILTALQSGDRETIMRLIKANPRLAERFPELVGI